MGALTALQVSCIEWESLLMGLQFSSPKTDEGVSL